MSNEPETPVIEVVNGSPTADEIAAVVTVLTAAAGRGGSAATGTGSDRGQATGWNAYWRSVRREHRPGPGAWLGR